MFFKLKKKILHKISIWYWDLMKVDFIRYRICRFRWFVRRRNLKISTEQGPAIAKDTINYNLSAFNQPNAAFGCGGRMSLLLFPLAVLLREKPNAKVLIIGPRTEDDILWAHALGLKETRGLDLFSYSEYIDLGDMHQMNYPNQQFDAILLAWVLAYSNQPEKAVKECKRLLKNGGYLGVGMQSVREKSNSPYKPNNNIWGVKELQTMINEDAVFICDSTVEVSAIFKIRYGN